MGKQEKKEGRGRQELENEEGAGGLSPGVTKVPKEERKDQSLF